MTRYKSRAKIDAGRSLDLFKVQKILKLTREKSL